MAVTKKIEIDGKEVTFKASAAVPRLYRIKFGRDIYKDLRQLEKSVGENDEDNSNLDLFSLEMFEDLAWLMARHADPANVPDSPEEFLDQFNTDQILDVGHIRIQPCALLRKYLIGHNDISGIHRSLVGGFTPDLRLDVLILLLVVDLVDALYKGNAEVELAALDGGFLDLTKTGLHASVSGRDDAKRADGQKDNKNKCKQRNDLLHSFVLLL